MVALHPVCKISELGEGQCKTFTVEGKEIAVYNAGGEWCATEDTCLHKGGSSQDQGSRVRAEKLLATAVIVGGDGALLGHGGTGSRENRQESHALSH